MNAKHTPGNWFTCGFNNYTVNTILADGTECTIVLMPGGSPQTSIEEVQANARLIAAAPAMFAALEEIAEMTTSNIRDEPHDVRDIARAAIAKAESR